MAPWANWLPSNWLPASRQGGNSSYQGHSASNPLAAANNSNNPFITNDSNDPIMRERLFRRASNARASEAVEDIDANWMEVDSDIDSPVDDNYDPRAYRPPVSRLERASNMACNATATAGSLASTATSIVASAATTVVQTTIQAASDIATANEYAYRGLSTRDSVRDPLDGLILRLPGQRLGLWETDMSTPEAEGMRGPEDTERSTSSGFSALNMNLSEIVRAERGKRESQERVSTNSQRARWEKSTRRNGLKGAGSVLGSNSQVQNDAATGSEQSGGVFKWSERNGDERAEDSSSEDSEDNSFDSIHEAMDNRGEYIVGKAQRRFQRKQQKKRAREERKAMEERKVMEEKRAKEKRDKAKGTSVQQRGPYLHQSTNSTIGEESIRLQPTPTERSLTHPSSRQPRDTDIPHSRPRRPPSPGSSRIAMVSYNVDRLPRSSRSDGVFEWN
ncbi:hypothetical protein IWX90DRAFT_416506 [Phyllosticta citrichinensis]|uniref:Uncharacterized protein n=1 Tax=Phyllosticta citrichinensis TaxID=1130410 RepID=A0ABR1XMQ4_9PEZI